MLINVILKLILIRKYRYYSRAYPGRAQLSLGPVRLEFCRAKPNRP